MEARIVFEAEAILKTTPPRLPASALDRRRLVAAWKRLHACTAVVLCAPAGYGKTTLMLQWRRRWLRLGAFVAWLSVDARDDAHRLAQGLLRGLRVATGQAVFERVAEICSVQPERMLEAMTAMLAEVATLGAETVLMLDESERLPGPEALQLLDYLLRNAPPNLHLVLACRVPLAIASASASAELSARGDFGLLEAEDLRFTQEEASEILAHRFAGAIDLDQCVRLHDLTEGWPIALQLAAATLERGSDLAAGIAGLSGASGDLGNYFLESLFAALPAEVADFATRISILVRLDRGACLFLTRDPMAESYLRWLARETPIVYAPERGSWLHLHRLAREFLLGRFAQLAAAERNALHERAREWFEQAEQYHEAAFHAEAAGNLAATQANAARALWSLGTQGRIAEARAWLPHIPPRMLAEDVELRLYAAWSLVFGERNAEALAIAQATLADPGATPRTRMIATRVAGGAAICADRLDLLRALLHEWPSVEAPHPLYLYSRENGLAVLALHAGDTAGVRERAEPMPADWPSLSLALTFSRLLLALSYWQEGNAMRVEALLRPCLRAADFNSGRRGMLPCMLAPVLAAAVREMGQPAAARAILADRLDVIERSGEPDSTLAAHRTLAAAALDLGEERQALKLLDNLQELAASRALPRLSLHALADSVRLHACRGRNETAAAQLTRLAALRGRFEQPALRPLLGYFELEFALAGAQLALSRERWDEAQAHITAAEALCEGPGRTRERLRTRTYRAMLVELRGEAGAETLLRETQSLAELGGLRRVLLDVHPRVAELLGRDPIAPLPIPATAAPLPPSPGALLTAKEAEILGLLAAGLPNKAIASATEVSGETVKWHLKNIYGKLSAGSRKHAVDRARLLGLIPG